MTPTDLAAVISRLITTSSVFFSIANAYMLNTDQKIGLVLKMSRCGFKAAGDTEGAKSWWGVFQVQWITFRRFA